MNQRTTKPTIRPVWLAKPLIGLYIHPVCQGFSLISVLIVWRLKKAHAIREDWSDCADAQADLSFHWSHKSYCRFCHALAQMVPWHPYLFKSICLRLQINKSSLLMEWYLSLQLFIFFLLQSYFWTFISSVRQLSTIHPYIIYFQRFSLLCQHLQTTQQCLPCCFNQTTCECPPL